MDENVLSIDLQLLELKNQNSLSPVELRQRVESIKAAAERIHYQHGLAEAMLFLAHLLWADMAYTCASRMIKQAIQLAKNEGALNLLAEAHHLCALIHSVKGRYTLALSQWLKCLKLMYSVQQENLYIDVLIGFGNLWAMDQQNEKSLSELKLALDGALRIKNQTLATKAAICLSREQLKLGFFEEALHSLKQAEANLGALDNATWQAEIYNYRARVWLALGDLERAHADCLYAWQSVSQHSDLMWAQCLTLISLAQITLAKNQNPLEYLDQATALAQQYRLKLFLSPIALIRSKYAEKQGLWHEALINFKQYRQFNLSELIQHQQQERRESNVIQFTRLIQQIEIQRQKNTANPAPTAPSTQATTLPHNALSRYLWLQKLGSYPNAEYGIVFVRLPSKNEHFSPQRKTYLLATLCRESSFFCQYSADLYAIIIPALNAEQLIEYHNNLHRILSFLPIHRSEIGLAATLVRPGQTFYEVLQLIESPLYMELATACQSC